MEFEIVDESQVPKRVVESKYSAIKAALKHLPVGKAIKINTNGGMSSSIKSNIPLWGTQWDCFFATRNDKENKCFYVWKVNPPATENSIK